MFRLLSTYAHWLHTQWPAGKVEKLPVVGPNGETNVSGVYIAGDLAGVPLLKFALQSGVRSVRAIAAEPALRREKREPSEDLLDLAILGGGVSGHAAAVEAKKHGLSFELIEANRPFSTLANFPKGKPIFTYPKEMTPEGDLQVRADVKEALVEELEAQVGQMGIAARTGRAETIHREGKGFRVDLQDQPPVRARKILIAIGQSGDYRRLGVPGEDLEKVYNRLHDPKDFAGKRCLVVGGGDSSLETSIALAGSGAQVTLSYRGERLSRPKPENTRAIESLERAAGANLTVILGSHVTHILADSVTLSSREGRETPVPNDVVFVMVGREAPLAFLRGSGVRIQGDWGIRRYATLSTFLLFCVLLYLWKTSGNPVFEAFLSNEWFPYNLGKSLSALAEHPQTLLGTLALSMATPSFWYGLAYSVIVTGFGIARLRRRRTPYVTAQTWTLIAIQVLPLFLLPSILLPWLGHNGLLPAWFEDTFFPVAGYDPHGREYWRAAGFILAWPLFIHNVFSDQPMAAWLVVCALQTFVLIPVLIYFYGKGAYCGWICSCGALAETLGDTHRSKMPHGPEWNRLNLAGQVILAFTFILLALRLLGWAGVPGAAGVFYRLEDPVYKYGVDVTLSGILGVGLYFHFSGRVWCRFFCPLAALMHIYARFSRFRILSEKRKCISCNACTAVCHQGIDVMNFANKGEPMADPECVRCSACVQTCPTGVLSFGQVDRKDRVIRRDHLAGSTLRQIEGV